MITEIRYTPYFDKRLAKKIKGKPQLKKKVSNQLKKLIIDIRHPSLKMHRLKGNRSEEYSIWIEDNLRIIFQIVDGAFLLTDIITHDEY